MSGESLEDAQTKQDEDDDLPATTFHDITFCKEVKDRIKGSEMCDNSDSAAEVDEVVKHTFSILKVSCEIHLGLVAGAWKDDYYFRAGPR